MASKKAEPFGFMDEKDEDGFAGALREEQGYEEKEKEDSGKRDEILAILQKIKDGELDIEDAANDIMDCCGMSL